MTQELLSQFWVQKLGWTLLHFLWQGTAIALLYALLRALFGRALSPQGRYALACLALAAMALAPPLTFLLIPREGNGLPAVAWNVSTSAWQRLLPGFVAVWLFGVLTFSIRLFGGWRFTAHLCSASLAAPPDWQKTLEDLAHRVGTSRPVRLLVSSLVEVPTVIGWLRPVILLPVGALTGLPLEQVAALLAHELAHIRRHDYLANIVQSIAEAVLFYHPAVWWISEQIRAERELCCDDLAVAASGDVLTYARALAQLETLQQPPLRTALAANGGSLINRVRRLIDPTQPSTESLPGAGPAWAMTLLLLAGVGVATVHAAQTPSIREVKLRAVPVFATSTPMPTLARPVMATTLASYARDTLLFDPLLSSRVVLPPGGTDLSAGSGGDQKSDSQAAAVGPEMATREPEAAIFVAAPDYKLPVMAQTNSLPVPVSAQAAQEQSVRAGTQRVHVEVVVRDNKGPIEGLRQGDFQLFDNGNEQAIGGFSVIASKGPQRGEPDGSATILLIDRICTSFADDTTARLRVAEILRAMPAGEPIAIYTLDSEFRMLSDFGDSPEQRGHALAEAWEAHAKLPNDVEATKLRALEATAGRLTGMRGRKRLIWISTEFPVVPEGDATLYSHMIRTVNEVNGGDIAVFPIAAEGLGAPRVYPQGMIASPFPRPNATVARPAFNLAFWAEKTGGMPAFNTEIGAAVQRAFEDAQVTYALEFSPETLDGRFHELKVKVDRRNVEVRSREGYLASAASAPTGGNVAGPATANWGTIAAAGVPGAGDSK